MPGQSGFDVIEAVGHTKFPHVIFVTAHDHYAIRAFEVNALDYLLKPIDDERFDIAFSRARDSITRDRDGTLARRLASALNDIAPSSTARHTPDRIVVRSAGRVCFVRTSDVDWIQASGDYVTLHTGKKEWLLRETLTEFRADNFPGKASSASTAPPSSTSIASPNSAPQITANIRSSSTTAPN